MTTIAAVQSYSDQRTYQQQQDDYQQKLQQYNDQRAAYDRQQADRQQPSDWRSNDRGYDSRRSDYRGAPCDGRSSNGAAGGLFGALAGAAIGSSLAGRGSHTEGAVLGAVAGGVIGSSVGASSARCDDRGYYYSRNQTLAYRESPDYQGRNSGRYDYRYYRSNGCRLVVVPGQWDGRDETRYARVCPDGSGRYRLTE